MLLSHEDDISLAAVVPVTLGDRVHGRPAALRQHLHRGLLHLDSVLGVQGDPSSTLEHFDTRQYILNTNPTHQTNSMRNPMQARMTHENVSRQHCAACNEALMCASCLPLRAAGDRQMHIRI